MQIKFNLPHVFSPSSSKVDNAYALRVLLDCQVALNLAYLRTHTVPGLYQSGVRYGRTVLWEAIPAFYMPNKHQKFGSIFYFPLGSSGGEKKADCKSLGPALVAEMLHKGEQARAVFRFSNRPGTDGVLDFHILVQTETGWKDPSRDLGMGKDELAHFGPVYNM